MVIIESVSLVFVVVVLFVYLSSISMSNVDGSGIRNSIDLNGKETVSQQSDHEEIKGNKKLL